MLVDRFATRVSRMKWNFVLNSSHVSQIDRHYAPVDFLRASWRVRRNSDTDLSTCVANEAVVSVGRLATRVMCTDRPIALSDDSLLLIRLAGATCACYVRALVLKHSHTHARTHLRPDKHTRTGNRVIQNGAVSTCCHQILIVIGVCGLVANFLRLIFWLQGWTVFKILLVKCVSWLEMEVIEKSQHTE